MPDDSAELDVKLVRNDGSQEIILKVSNIERSMKNSLTKKSIISGVGDLAGKDLALGFENFSLQGQIAESDADTYPDALVDPDMTGYPNAAAKESAVAEATREWGPDKDDLFDTLEFGPYTGAYAKPGIIGKWSSSLDLESNKQWQYSYTLEWERIDILLEEG